MNLNDLNRANEVLAKLSEKKALLRRYEQGKIHSITIVTFNEETGLNEFHTETADIPRNKFKVSAVEVLREKIANLNHQFANVGTPRPNDEH